MRVLRSLIMTLSILSAFANAGELKDKTKLKDSYGAFIAKIEAPDFEKCFNISIVKPSLKKPNIHSISHNGICPTKTSYILRKTYGSGIYSPYEITQSKGKYRSQVLYGELIGNLDAVEGLRSYQFDLEPGKISYIGDLKAVKISGEGKSAKYKLVVTNEFEAAKAYIEKNYPRLFGMYEIVESLTEEVAGK